MGAPIVVNTVKVQGTVASSGITAIQGTVSQNATWNVNAIQSGNWNIGGTVSQGGTWTVTANVGSGTQPVSNTNASALFVQGTVSPSGITSVSGTVNANVSNVISSPLSVQGTVAIPALSPAYVAGTVTSNVAGTVNVGNSISLSGSVETYTNGIATVAISAGTVTFSNSSIAVSGSVTSNVGSGTRPVSNTNSSALFVQGTTTATNIANNALFIQGSVTALPGTATTNLGKAEDAAFTSGDVGVMSLAVRNDSGTTLTNANLDYSPFAVDSIGRLQIIERGVTIAQGSATLGTAMGTILTSSSTRRSILIQNLGSDYIWIGGSTAIVVNTGARLAPGQAITIDKSPNSAIYAVASSGSQIVSYFAESD
jgi:hypothetical protein